MRYEHQGMQLWIEPNDRLASGIVEAGSDVNLTLGVEPADASNRVQVVYRVNGGTATAIPAEPVRHVGNAQYFKTKLPCAALCEGDTVEYSAICQCAGRQVPSAEEIEGSMSSFRVVNAIDNLNAVENYDRARIGLSALRSGAFDSIVPPPSRLALSRFGNEQQTVQNISKPTIPTHLSVFASAKNTGHPIARMPFYAEVGVVSVSPQPKCNLQEAIRAGIIQLITSEKKFSTQEETDFKLVVRGLLDRLIDLLCDGFGRLLAPKVIEKWVSDHDSAASAVVQILQTASELAKGRNMDWNNPQMLGSLLEEAILAYATRNNLPKPEANAPSRIVWAHPLGVLATDHVGYLSFDLTRLPPDVANAVALAMEERRRNPNISTDTSIWLYPMAQEEGRIDALAQMRFAHDAIVVKLELDAPQLSPLMRNMGLLAMQNPGLTDWRLSPASFATNPGALLGEDGCENLFPANVALQEYYFYQVIGLTDSEVQPPELPPNVKDKVRVGFVNEYRLAWYPLGHSLGQIQYSLPLAPGESVNLAIIDWTRRDVGQRTEDTKEAEQLVHNQRRDRTITETVNAAIQEHQRGSSFMGGLAGSAGASIPIKAVNISVGATHSLGGAMSKSSGSRDIAASTVQKLSDNITQSSAAMRELQSTVVVQTTQHEKEAIETRTVVNYNHSHALTILYYEVLRHFRVVTEFVRRRPVVLVKIDTDWMILPPEPASAVSNDSTALALPYSPKVSYWSQYHQRQQTILENRATLEAALLDKKYVGGLDAFERMVHRNKLPKSEHPKPVQPAGPLLHFFNFDIKVGGEPGERTVNVHAKVFGPTSIKGYSGEEIKLWEGVKLNDYKQLNPPGSFLAADTNYSFTGRLFGIPPIPWGAIDAIEINVYLEAGQERETAVSFQHIRVTGIDIDGKSIILVDKSYREAGFEGDLYMDNNWVIWLPTKRPDPPPPPPPRPAEEIEDEIKVDELIDHLTYHKAHYTRALFLNQNPADRASQLDAIELGNNATLLEKIENRPLEIVGDFVAYPCSDKKWADRIENFMKALPLPELIPDERLVTLPTRGVFAEAKLGHCNASEEIDNTRFWDWQQSPIPHMAPEIAPIQGVTPQPQQQNLSPTPFPQSLVNIVNPPAAPDPTGLAAALNVLGTPNIFRDMSGRAEVADLLKKLSDNSVAIADVARKGGVSGAGQSGGGSGSSSGSSTGGGGGSTPSIGGSRARPNEPSAVNRDLQDSQNVLRNAVDKGLISPQDASSRYKQLMDEFGVTPGRKSLIEDPNAIASSDAAFVPTPSGRSTFDILADANYIDKFDDAHYDEVNGLIYMEYNKKGRTLGLPVHVISENVTDADLEEDAIQNFEVDNPPNSELDKAIYVPQIFNPHTTPRLASYAKKVRVWQQEVDRAFDLALFSLQLAITIGSMAPGEGFGPAPATQVLRLPVRRFAARTAMRLTTESQMVGKVAYGATDLSRLSQAARVSAGADKGKNFAAIEFKNAAGQLQKRGAASKGSLHAEEVLRDELIKEGVDPKDVTRLYSEYQPCTQRVGGTPCAVMVQKVFPNAKVTYSFPYSDPASRDIGRTLLKEAIEQLKRFFAAGGVP